MTATHTPAPWTPIQYPDEYTIAIIGPNGDERIADVGGNETRHAEDNARLIAGAPEMYELLQRMWHYFHSLPPTDTRTLLKEQADAILAKINQ